MKTVLKYVHLKLTEYHTHQGPLNMNNSLCFRNSCYLNECMGKRIQIMTISEMKESQLNSVLLRFTCLFQSPPLPYICTLLLWDGEESAPREQF